MRPTTPGLCEDECEVAGTIRIVGNTTWVPELLDRNTREWQQLANEIEKEVNYYSRTIYLFVKTTINLIILFISDEFSFFEICHTQKMVQECTN